MKYDARHRWIAVGAIGTLVLAGLGAWKEFWPKYNLEADILITRAVFPYELRQSLDKMGQLSLDWMKKDKKIKVPLSVIKEAKPAFKALLSAQVNSTIASFQGLPGIPASLTVIRVHNNGDNTLYGVTVRSGGAAFSQVAQIYKDEGPPKIEKFKKDIVIGNMSPRSEVTAYVWDSTGISSFGGIYRSGTVVTHRDGIGKIYYFTPVPSFIFNGGGGIWFSYYWTTIALTVVLVLVVTAWITAKIRQKVRAADIGQTDTPRDQDVT